MKRIRASTAAALLIICAAAWADETPRADATADEPETESDSAEADEDVADLLASAEAEEEAEKAQRRALAEALVARGDAGSLATSAMLYHLLGEGSKAVEISGRAARSAQDAAHLAWLELGMCLEHRGCDPTPAARRLLTVDPGNGVAFLHEAPEEGAAPARMNQFLERLAQADRLDTHWNRLLAAGYDALEAIDGRKGGDIGADESYDGRGDVISVVAATALLDVTSFFHACTAEAMVDSTRRDACLRVARVLQGSDTILAEVMGLALEKRAWERGSREHRAVSERGEQLTSLQRQSSQHTGDPLWYERSITTMRAHRTEREAMQALVALYAAERPAPSQANPFSTVAVDPAAALFAAEESSDTGRTTRTPGEGKAMHFQPLEVNFLAVLAAAVSAFLLGGLWYSNALFGLVWNREAGKPVEKSPHRGRVFATGFALSFVAAWVFAAILPATIIIAQAALFGVIVGAAWVATSFGINYGFGDRSLKLWLIDAGYHTLQFALYGVIIAAWR